MRKGSKVSGVKPWTAQPLDDDLLRPWRQWWGISIWMHLRTRRGDGIVRAGDRNMLRRRCRYAFWTRNFVYFGPGDRRHIVRTRGSRQQPKPSCRACS